MLVSRAKILCFSAGLLILQLIVLPGHAQKLEPCKPEQVEVDLERHLTIHYSLCDDPGSVCLQQHNDSCEPEKEFEEISEAQLVDQNGNSHTLKVRDDRKGFRVLLPGEVGERFTSTGIFHYNITYMYEAECTYPLNRGCTGWVRDLRLSVTVVDYKLNLSLSNDVDILKISATDEMQIQSERNVSLVCSSGLSDEFSSLDIPVTFLFHSKHDNDEHNVSATCNSDNTVSVNNGKWIITRQQSPPHDCVLTIVDFGEHNVGKYRCAGVLSQSSSLILQVDDWSNNLHLKLLTNLKPVRDFSLSQLGVWATIFFGVIVTSIAAIFLAFLVIASYSAYKRHRRRRRGLIYDQVPPRSYGSHLSLRQNNDLSRPNTPNPDMYIAAENQPLIPYNSEDVNAEVFEPGSEIESSIDRRDNDSSETSSGDSMQLDNIYSDADLTDIARAGTELTPPCNHRGTCDKSLICQCCNKAYCIYQSEYFTRHWKKCKSITDESDHEPDTLSGGSSNQQIIHSASPPLDQTTAGSGVDQHDLNFMSESSSNQPSSLESNSDSKNTKS